ncbi:hypothetical protein D1AOALGA4SA_5241 [Olavius algarvensis Delta 1 endosymbiont]|nr:hypothetical protein D1AOALGA4SA_5241 [Olavius algarvensis Delta 1 endosymbiont]
MAEDRGQRTEDRSGKWECGRRKDRTEGFDCGMRIAECGFGRRRTEDRSGKWAFGKLRRDKVGPVVLRYGGTMPRLKMRKGEKR